MSRSCVHFGRVTWIKTLDCLSSKKLITWGHYWRDLLHNQFKDLYWLKKTMVQLLKFLSSDLVSLNTSLQVTWGTLWRCQIAPVINHYKYGWDLCQSSWAVSVGHWCKPIWEPIIMDWLLVDVCLQIVRITTKDIWQIEELLKILKTEVGASDWVKVTEIHNPTIAAQEPPVNSICIDGMWNQIKHCVLCLL